MRRSCSRHHRSRSVAPDTWVDFFRVLLVCFAGLSMTFPAGESAVVADDEAREAGVVRSSYASAGFRHVVRLVVHAVADDEELEGGPDDDDFRPCPDRACGPSVRHAVSLSPLIFRCVSAPPASSEALRPSIRSPHFAAATLIPPSAAYPALDSCVQILR